MNEAKLDAIVARLDAKGDDPLVQMLKQPLSASERKEYNAMLVKKYRYELQSGKDFMGFTIPAEKKRQMEEFVKKHG